MRTQEFNNLADWFKENVLDIPCTNDESYAPDMYEKPHLDTNNIDNGHLELGEPSEAEAELSLIEYIIGIDEII